MRNYTLKTPIEELPRVGETRKRQLEKLGIRYAGDLAYFLPRAYEKRGDVIPLSEMDAEKPRAYVVTVASVPRSARLPHSLTLTKFRAFDDTGYCEISFFNSPYVCDIFHVGDRFRIYGKALRSKNCVRFTNPKYEPYSEAEPLDDFIPIYPLTAGLSSKFIDSLMRAALPDILSGLVDPLPEDIRLSQGLPTIGAALRSLHFPTDEAGISSGFSRLGFDEMFEFALGISMSAHEKRLLTALPFEPTDIAPLLKLLPYELTTAQKHAVNDIYRDTVRKGDASRIPPMTRILIGDVGSGKTICALIAIYLAAKSGHQSVLMVPTEILARQHYNDACTLLGKLGIKSELLIGSTSKKKKRQILADAESGVCDVIVGTHAVISDGVNFSDLALVITDEQHRFGVMQRAALKGKSDSAHLLVMSATPIPRTLALAMYGDLDISEINEMPKGRQRVDTFVVNESYRGRLNGFIRKTVSEGGQCYVVCPSIDEPETENVMEPTSGYKLTPISALNLKSTLKYTETLRAALPELRISCLHGRMKAKEKNDVMESFVSGDTDVLVSTTVIEVGVNVPNASLMVIENAERFGLSQLHQLRGRVGRGSRKSYCILVSDSSGDAARERLEVMRTVYDGAKIAERDLMLRGPGDFFPQNSSDTIRQSGGFEFNAARMCNDTELMNRAFSCAKALMQKDPGLREPEHAPLREKMKKILDIDLSTIS